MKQGRGRIYPAFNGMESEIGFLLELHARATDLVAGLPVEVMSAELYGHSVGQLLDHMIQAEIDWISRVADIRRPSPVSTCDEIAHFTRRVLARFTLDSEIAKTSKFHRRPHRCRRTFPQSTAPRPPRHCPEQAVYPGWSRRR